MNLLLDFLPAILFFAGFKLGNIYIATGVAMAASIVLIAWSLIRREPVKPVQWISLGFIAFFGSLTILLHDEFYIKLKWTLFYASMGIAMLVATAMNKNPLKSLMGQELVLPEKVWRQLSLAWAGYFLLLAALNQYFATVLTLEQWVNVKIFGGLALLVVFTIAQGVWIYKYLPQETEKKDS